MKKLFTFLLFIMSLQGQAQNKSIKETYSLCEAEFGRCDKTCSVVLVMGKKIEIGSYIKVYLGKELMTQGYILKHVSGRIFILPSKNLVSKPVSWGCGGDDESFWAYLIDIKSKQIWGC